MRNQEKKTSTQLILGVITDRHKNLEKKWERDIIKCELGLNSLLWDLFVDKHVFLLI